MEHGLQGMAQHHLERRFGVLLAGQLGGTFSCKGAWAGSPWAAWGVYHSRFQAKIRKSGALLQPLMRAQEFKKKFPKITTSLAAPFPLRGLQGL